ncbi:hypothetical protein KY342_03515 [Candidatus Woesearchaeota archaeon]|nr:hypothetical protein [Candidatus Woesearchaeota archaeon]
MNSLEIIEIVIAAEALGMMLFALIKFQYADIYIYKMPLNEKIKVLPKYRVFKRILFFTFIFILSFFIHKIISINAPSSTAAYLFSILGYIFLLLLAYTLYRFSWENYKTWELK